MSKREFGVDLLRIIAALLVITLHILVQGGILDHAPSGGAAYWTSSFLEICAYCAVNCFALISGYTMVGKTMKIKRVIGLWLQVCFYSLLVTFLFFISVPETKTVRNLVLSLLPVTCKQWWYVSGYFALVFCVPILNAAIDHISRKTYEKFLAVVLIGVCVIACAVPRDAFSFLNGYSAIWLIVLYLFGAYIKKYELKQRITTCKAMLGFLTVTALTFFSKIVIYFVTQTVFGENKYDDLFVSYTSITIVLAAIFLFLFCLNCKIGSFAQKMIGLLAPTSFGVYLIHVHPLVFQYILEDAFVSFLDKPLLLMVICILAATFAIYTLCVIMEWLRIQLFKLIRVNKLCEIAENKIAYLCLKLWKE